MGCMGITSGCWAARLRYFMTVANTCLELPEHVIRQHLRLCFGPLAEHAAGVPVGAQDLVDLLAETLCTRCLLYQLEEGIVDGSCLPTLMLGELGDLRGSRFGLRAGTRLIGLRGNGGST